MPRIFSTVDSVAHFNHLKTRVEKREGGFEFEDYFSYSLAFGSFAMPENKWNGSDGAWLVSDRKNLTTR
ncbi:MAG: hypothetical protein Q8R57_11605, partial [Bacteroidota bacterium]|nr:hypothetical protein [Bacteroidota bacterium]